MFSKQINLLVISLLLLVKGDYAQRYYCQLESCSNPERHILCLLPRPVVHDRCIHLIRSSLTSNEKDILLNAHNNVRQEYATHKNKGTTFPEIRWNNDLEEMAQRWADQCTPDEDECRSIDEYGYVVKQNVGKYNVRDNFPKFNKNFSFDLAEVVNDWARKPFNPANPAVRTYKAIDRIGCGLTVKSECDWRTIYPAGGRVCLSYFHVFVVCNYAILNMRLRT